MKAELFLIKAQKALYVLKTQGLKALISRLRIKTNIGKNRSFGGLNDITTKPITESKAIFIGRTLNREKLNSKISSGLNGSVLKIAFSHDNYLENVGGLQLKIADEQLEVNQSEKNYLHIFPYGAGLTLTKFKEDSVIGINLNGEWIGYTSPQIFTDYLSENSTNLTVEGLSIHHTMGFDLRFIEKVIELSQHPKIVFWLHDFFSLCPGYLLLRSNLEFCGAPDVTSNACLLCVYGDPRIKHIQEFEKFFTENLVEVISPSEFALQLWKEAFPVKGVASTVCPHAFLDYQDPIPNNSRNTAIKIAFVGFPVYHKGWETWLKLTEKFGSDPRYEFFLFSEIRRRSRNFKNVSISVTKDSRNEMAETLRDYNIDVAFLWSICPDTFSFTLYESLSAGCIILTNRNSGNIQAYVKAHPETGLVIDNEESLMQLFEETGLRSYVIESQKGGKRCGNIAFNQGDRRNVD